MKNGRCCHELLQTRGHGECRFPALSNRFPLGSTHRRDLKVHAGLELSSPGASWSGDETGHLRKRRGHRWTDVLENREICTV